MTSRAETTARLLARLRHGDDAARDELVGRYFPVLRRWAHGRLPARARGALETDDLVQTTMLRAMGHLENLESTREGALLAYLRRTLLNAVRDELRRVKRRPPHEPLEEEPFGREESALDRFIGQETYAAFDAALGSLDSPQQEAVVLRLEFGFSYADVAAAVGSPSANAARMMVSRALVSVAQAMSHHR